MGILDPTRYVEALGPIPAAVQRERVLHEQPKKQRSLWGDAFMQENATVNAVLAITNPHLSGSYGLKDGYNPYTDDAEIAFRYGDDYADAYMHSLSPEETMAISRRIEEELARRENLANSGGAGMVAAMGAGILSFETIIPGFGIVKASKGYSALRGMGRAAQAGSLAKSGFVRGGVNVGVESVFQEVIAQEILDANQFTRTTEEKVYAMLGAAVLGGTLGGIAGSVGRIRSGLRELVTEEIQSGVRGTATGRLMESKQFQGLTGDEQRVLLAKSLMDGGETRLAKLVGDPKSWLGKLWRKGWRWNPQGRLDTSQNGVLRIAVRALTDNPSLRTSDFKLGDDIVTSVDAATTMRYAKAADAMLNVRQAYGQLRKSGSKMTQSDFNMKVSQLMRAGDEIPSQISDEAQRSAFRKAITAARKVFDDLGDDAERVGLISSRDLKGTAKAYVMRVWNLEAVKNDEFGLRKILGKHFAAAGMNEKEILDATNQAIDGILKSPTGSTFFHSAVGEAASFKGRKILLPDKELEDFLENDITNILNRFTNDVAPQVELARLFRSTGGEIDNLLPRLRAALASGDRLEMEGLIEDAINLNAAEALAGDLTVEGTRAAARVDRLNRALPRMRKSAAEAAERAENAKTRVDAYDTAQARRAEIEEEVGVAGFEKVRTGPAGRAFDEELSERFAKPREERIATIENEIKANKAQRRDVRKERTRQLRKPGPAKDSPDLRFAESELKRLDDDMAALKAARKGLKAGDPDSLAALRREAREETQAQTAAQRELADVERAKVTGQKGKLRELKGERQAEGADLRTQQRAARAERRAELTGEGAIGRVQKLLDESRERFGRLIRRQEGEVKRTEGRAAKKRAAREADEAPENLRLEQEAREVAQRNRIAEVNDEIARMDDELLTVRQLIKEERVTVKAEARTRNVPEVAELELRTRRLDRKRIELDKRLKKQRDLEAGEIKARKVTHSRNFFAVWRRWVKGQEETLFPRARAALEKSGKRVGKLQKLGDEYVRVVGVIDRMRGHIPQFRRDALLSGRRLAGRVGALDGARAQLRALRLRAKEIDDSVQVNIDPVPAKAKTENVAIRAQNEVAAVRRKNARAGVDLRNVIAAATREFNAKIDKLGSSGSKEARRLRGEFENEISDLRTIRSRILNEAQIQQGDGSNWAFRAERTFRRINHMLYMGGVMLSSIPDIAMPIMVHGFTPWFNTMRFAMKNNLGEVFIRANAKIVDEDELLRLAVALEYGSHARAHAYGDIGNMGTSSTKIGKGIERAADTFTRWTLIDRWNALHKAVATLTTMNRAMDDISTLITGKTLNGVTREITRHGREALASSGISESMAKRIHDQWKEFGDLDGTQALPRTQDWTDLEAKFVFQNAVTADVRRTIITPSSGDLPRWTDLPFLRLANQFRSFTSSSTTKILQSGLQRHDAAVFQGALFSVTMASMAWAIKHRIRGNDPFEEPVGRWVQEGIDRSGVFGWLMDGNAHIEQATQGTIGLSRLTTGTAGSRFSARSALYNWLGPSIGTAEKGIGVFQSLWADGGPKPRDFGDMRELVPFNQVFWLRGLFDTLESGEFRTPLQGRAQ